MNLLFFNIYKSKVSTCKILFLQGKFWQVVRIYEQIILMNVFIVKCYDSVKLSWTSLGPAFEFGIEVILTFTKSGLDLKFRFYRILFYLFTNQINDSTMMLSLSLPSNVRIYKLIHSYNVILFFFYISQRNKTILIISIPVV